jgi:hypothetical protein
LATLFVVVTVLCVWLAYVVNRVNRQREAVAAIEALGGVVAYEPPNKPESTTFPRPFLRRWLARDYFDEVREAYLGGNRVTDAGLAHLQGLMGLRRLFLFGPRVTDASLAHLQGLTGLRELDFDGAQVTDAGLEHLHGLTSLQVLQLNGTQITKAGLAQIRQALPGCEVTTNVAMD